MKKIIMIVAMAACAFSFSEANAQKVIKDGDGNVFIDVTDLPAGGFSTTTLNTVTLPTAAGNSVFKKFQVSKSDLPTTMTWAAAVGLAVSFNTATAVARGQGTVNTGCKDYTEDGSGWRVPTLKEMQLIWIMKNALLQAGTGAFQANDRYWSSAEESTVNSWFVHFLNGYTNGNVTKVSNYYVRCVREVTN